MVSGDLKLTQKIEMKGITYCDLKYLKELQNHNKKHNQRFEKLYFMINFIYI